MELGNHLFYARKKQGLSQEEVAEKLGVSRQTISKWETGETLLDIRQAKRLAGLYHLTLDELIDFDLDVQEVVEVIERTSEAVEEKINWTKAWGKRYPILLQYQGTVNVERYTAKLELMLEELKRDYGYNELDTFLVLKDILAQVWYRRKKLQKEAGRP
ncbi:MAG: helix-turn-helix transcriptional regulator [Oscillospiraceae bacterium]|nr:helix-turn-helix transcriptional regulator [Oscillospiraceae bacterium]